MLESKAISFSTFSSPLCHKLNKYKKFITNKLNKYNKFITNKLNTINNY